MTRINLVPPAELYDQHLISEWRELTRIPNGILHGKYKVDLAKIPAAYTVQTKDNPKGGEGHMKFFFDKLSFLHDRYLSILDELWQREMPQANRWPWQLMAEDLHNDYKATPEAIALNRQRILEQFPKKARYARVLI